MIVVFILFCVGLMLFCFQLAWHISVIRDGKPMHRWNCLHARLKNMLMTTLGQTRIIERPWGWAHVVLMWAFFVFLTSGLEMLVACLVPGFTWARVVGASMHGILCVIQTWFAWAALCGLVVMSTRRIVARKLTFTNFDACFILADIFVLMLTHIVGMSAQIAMGHTVFTAMMPIESSFASWVPITSAAHVHCAMSAIHLVLMAIFLVWIPNSKHLHIVLAWPDVFFFSREWFGRQQASYSPDPIDFEAYEKAVDEAIASGKEEMPSVGLGHFDDTTQKQRLEAMSCTLCRRCNNVCPMLTQGVTDKGPMEAMMCLRKMCVMAETRRQRVLAMASFGKKLEPEPVSVRPLMPALMSSDALWQCTQCGACDRACPLQHEHTLRIMMMRQNAVAQQENVPVGLLRCFEMTERSGNPWGYPKKARQALWTLAQTQDEVDKVTEVKRETQTPVDTPDALADGLPKRIALFAGCMASYDKKAAVTLRLIRQWLVDAGFDVSMIEGETCCGEPLRRAGNELGFETQVRENMRHIESVGADMIVTVCPHCAFTLSDSYRAYGMKVPAFHIVPFWRYLFERGALLFSSSPKGALALHIPCYLSKYADESAFILRMLRDCGYTVFETDKAHRASCCGAGGAKFFYDDRRVITQNRVSELLHTGAQKIGTFCPFCTQMLGDEVQNSGGNSLITCVNVIDELAECVQCKRMSK